MPHRTTSASRSELADRFLELRTALAAESPGALDRMAALAEQAAAAKDLPVTAASAGTAVLFEHVQWAGHRHASRMLGLLAAAGPDAASAGPDGLFAWAGAAVAHDYGVLPSWPSPDIDMLMERARHAPNDAALALGCALAEVCERNGEDVEFAALHAQMAAFEVQDRASPFWRGHWSIACAWHLHSFGKVAEASQRLEMAQGLAAGHGLQGLGATAALQRARLIECRRDPVQAAARKASSKPLELLRFLGAQGHAGVPVDVVAAALWAGDGREGRQKAFDITVARLRRLLGNDAAVGVSDRRVRLNEQCVWIDAQALNDRLADGEAAVERSAAANAALESALSLYRGPFLVDSREGWAGVARERLRARLAAALLRALRQPGAGAAQVREWTLRATSADPRVTELIGSLQPDTGASRE